MSGYIETFESVDDSYLQHEKTWGKHKYISRTKKGGRWIYSYPKSKADTPTNSDIENLAGIDSTDPADAAVLKQYKDYFNSSEYQNSPHKAIKDLSFDEQNDLIKKVSAYKDKNLQAIQKYASGSGESRLKKLLASSAKHSAFSNGYIETFETADDTYLEHFGVRGMHWGQRKKITGSLSSNQIRSNVKKYTKQNEATTKMYNKAYDQKQVALDLYKKTGKNRVSRIINNVKGKSKAVKDYQKQMNKATDTYNKAYDMKQTMLDTYRSTGKTKLTRILNNMKYNPLTKSDFRSTQEIKQPVGTRY